MGTWRIVVEGHGCHHNDRQGDANEMAAVFVGELRAAGHGVTSATFELTGSREDVRPPDDYVSGRNFEIVNGSAAGGVNPGDPTILRAA
ncbi:MAG TPA: hypothetical protein VFJ16_31215 [Longimicrobium sp.]|nr:hypothetical protein [Longimicrobium sp.]